MKIQRGTILVVIAVCGRSFSPLIAREQSPPQRDASHILAMIENWFTKGQVSKVAKVDRDTVYGMVPGLTFLMDVDYLQMPNVNGLVQSSGSGFTRQVCYDARQLKHNPRVPNEARPLRATGLAGWRSIIVRHNGSSIPIKSRRYSEHFDPCVTRLIATGSIIKGIGAIGGYSGATSSACLEF